MERSEPPLIRIGSPGTPQRARMEGSGSIFSSSVASDSSCERTALGSRDEPPQRQAGQTTEKGIINDAGPREVGWEQAALQYVRQRGVTQADQELQRVALSNRSRAAERLPVKVERALVAAHPFGRVRCLPCWGSG